MLQIIYITISVYFLCGAFGFWRINRDKPRELAKQSWIKFMSYFVIINTLFFSIVIDVQYFRLISLIIFLIAMGELRYVYSKSEKKHWFAYVVASIVLIYVAILYYYFSTCEQYFILYVFLLLSIFDSFSQISGQLFGKRKIAPRISPQKTYGGLLGGTITTIVSSFILAPLYPMSWSKTGIIALLICAAAFIGDITASYYKRYMGVKDYSALLPGHGGFLDRFDSLIGVGAILGLLSELLISC